MGKKRSVLLLCLVVGREEKKPRNAVCTVIVLDFSITVL